MIDFATVVTSVAATLSVQCLYFVWVRFPEELHKNISQAERLSALEDEEFSIYTRKREALVEAERAIADWAKLLDELEARGPDAPIDRQAFRNNFSPLTESLGKVRGLVSVFDRAGFNEVLGFEARRLELARDLTLSIIEFKTPKEYELSRTNSELRLLEYTMTARMGQVASEAEIRDVEFKVQIAEAEAAVNSIRRRLYMADISLGIVGAIAVTAAATREERFLWSGRNVSRRADFAFSSVCLAVFVSFMLVMGNGARRELKSSIWQKRHARKQKQAEAE